MQNKIFAPGSVVIATYNKFDGSEAEGLFVVLADEALDARNNMRDNVTVCKITSTFDMLSNNYCVPLNDSNNDFFDKPSMAVCSKVQTLSKSNQIKGCLGVLHSFTLRNIYKTWRKFEIEIDRQLENYI
jgi:mRNA-degrading endonuclease toxin of MazEF toxin-antitoxin module